MPLLEVSTGAVRRAHQVYAGYWAKGKLAALKLQSNRTFGKPAVRRLVIRAAEKSVFNRP